MYKSINIYLGTMYNSTNIKLTYIFFAVILSLNRGDGMSSTEAQKRAVKKWTEKRDNITIRIEKETGTAIRAAAAAAGQSVTAYILNAIQNGDTLPVDHAAINEHIAVTGESFGDFIRRAAKDTIDRDNQLLKMGMKPF